MDTITERVFNEFIDNLNVEEQFTAWDVIAYIQTRTPKHTPSAGTVGHLIKKHPRVYRVAFVNRCVVYGVIY